MKKKGDPDLYAPGHPCIHKCTKDCTKKPCKQCKKTKQECTKCAKNKRYELVKTGMVGGPSIVFCRYAEKDVTKIRSHIYKDAKTCQSVVGFDANSLYLYCSGQEMPCGKDEYVEIKEPTNPESTEKICKDIVDDSVRLTSMYLNILKKSLASFHLCLRLIAFLKS